MKSYRLLTGSRREEKSRLHIAGRCAATSTGADRNSGDGTPAAGVARGPCAAGPVRAQLPAANCPAEPVPIWLAVLLATSCEARRDGKNHAVRWNLISGRAVYTNAGRDAESIEPLGVSLLGGHTMAVCWMPGETAYTVEVYRQQGLCA